MPYLLNHFCGPVTVRVLDTFIQKNYVLGDERLYTLKVMQDTIGFRKGEILVEPAYKIYDRFYAKRNSMRIVYEGKNWIRKPIKERS
jgi:hypothetical protein